MKYLLTSFALILAMGAPAEAKGLPTSPCEYEDSRSCVWDAKHMGNGQGRSFWTGKAGKVHYISHTKAHRLIFG